jgi:AbiV family abortive infection protein
MPTAVSPTALLAGAWRAAEQAGYLFRDAAVLFDEGSYSSATALALLGREELGKYAILRDLWRRAAAGATISRSEVRDACEDHVDKQKRAQLSLVHRVRADPGAAKLFRSLLDVLPSSGAARGIRSQIERLDVALAKRRRTTGTS